MAHGLTKITEHVIKDSFKTAISGSDSAEMTLATASIAAITASVSTINDNMTLATASIAAITSSISSEEENRMNNNNNKETTERRDTGIKCSQGINDVHDCSAEWQIVAMTVNHCLFVLFMISFVTGIILCFSDVTYTNSN